jgi:hypothetical protein
MLSPLLAMVRLHSSGQFDISSFGFTFVGDFDFSLLAEKPYNQRKYKRPGPIGSGSDFSVIFI